MYTWTATTLFEDQAAYTKVITGLGDLILSPVQNFLMDDKTTVKIPPRHLDP